MSAGLAVWGLQSVITYTAIPGLDWVVSVPLGAALLTVFGVVAGVANSVNIIDGFNGLASMCVVMMLAAIAYVAIQVGDDTMATLALMGVGAVLGFFVWNFPGGLIFLGDGGAYFLGFYVAEARHPAAGAQSRRVADVPAADLHLPVFETLLAMYRRKVLRGRRSAAPTAFTCTRLIYRRVVRWAVGAHDAKSLTRRNSMTAPYLWLLCMCAVVPAMLFWDSTAVLASFILLFSLGYTVLYWRIVRFRAPALAVCSLRKRRTNRRGGRGQG